MGGGPSCLSDDRTKILKASGASMLTAPNGFDPQPLIFQFLQTCDTSTVYNRSLPCQTAPDAKFRNCGECGISNQPYLWTPGNLEKGPTCDDDGEFMTDELAYNIFYMHLVTWYRIQDLCQGVKVKDDTGATVGLEDVLWPEFYHFYNNAWGKCQVDAFLLKYPTTPAGAIAALKANYTDEVQSLYGLLNGYDFENAYYNWRFGETGNEYMGSRSAYNLMVRSQAVGKSGLLWETNAYKNYGTSSGTLNEAVSILKLIYRRIPVGSTDYRKGWYGNPLWDQNQWQEAFRKALGKDCEGKEIGGVDVPTTGADWIDIWAQAYVNMGLVGGGQSADNYFNPGLSAGMKNPYNDPGYTGNLPQLIDIGLLGPNMITRSTTDPTAHGYKSTCDSKSLTQKWIPIITAVVFGGVTSMVIPGQFSKVGAFGVGAYSGYEIFDYSFGQSASWYADTMFANRGDQRAALALSAGLPGLALTGLGELGLLPDALDSFPKKAIVVVAASGAGYYLLFDTIADGLASGSDLAEVLLAPVQAASNIIHWISSGCSDHEVHLHTVCKCEESNSKPLMTAALLEDLYGVTGEQLRMRTEAMEAALTTGVWGTDPYFMGDCNSDGWMSTPTACLSAGQWAYNIIPLELQNTAEAMRNQFLPAVDPNNPSFLPPTSADTEAVEKYGVHARAGGPKLNRMGEDGKFYDFRAPGNTTDPTQVGPQMELGLPTSYDWTGLDAQNAPPKKSECAIL